MALTLRAYALRASTMAPLSRSCRYIRPTYRGYATKNPSDLKYTKSHEWVRVNGDVGTVGITEHAQEALGDIVFVELPKVGSELAAGDSFGAVESVKAASSVYLPVSGTVLEVNNELETTPDEVNKSPYDKGWMVKVRLSKPEELKSLLDAAQYTKVAQEEEH